ncbi:MAG: cell division protein FtsA [Bacteroidales bacterium]
MSKCYTAAIDIGTSRVRVAVAKINDSKEVQLLGYAEEVTNGVINSEVLHIRNVADSIQRALYRVEQKLDARITKAFVNVGGRRFITKYFKFDKLVGESGIILESDVMYLENEVRNVKIQSDFTIYEICAAKYTVDGDKKVEDPVQMSGRKLAAEYTVVIGPKDYSRNIQKVFDDIGIDILKLSVDPITTSRLYISADEMEAGAILLDMGKGTTKCSVYVDGRVKLMYTIPLGGDSVTEDIKKGLNISYRNAEKLKLEDACSKIDTTEDDKIITIPQGSGWAPKEISRKNLSNIVEARVEEILGFLNEEFLRLNIHEDIGSGIIIVGGASRLKDVSGLISFVFGLPVKHGLPNFKIESSSRKILTHPLNASLSGLIAAKLGFVGEQGNIKMNSGDDIGTMQNNAIGDFFNNLFSKVVK